MHTLERPLFTVEHQGRTLTGRELLRTRRQLVVQLVHPFGLLHDSLFMPAFMAQSGLSLEGALGDEKRALLLRGLYDQATWLADLLPLLQRALPPDDDGTEAFLQHMDEALNAAHAPRPGATTVPLSALPWHHPHRFHREVAWLRAHATLPAVRIALPTTDREHEWQLLLLLFHTLHGRLGKWAEGFRWDLGAN